MTEMTLRPHIILALTCAASLLLPFSSLQAAGGREQRAFDAATAAFSDGIWERAEIEFGDFVRNYPKSGHRSQAVLFQAQARYKRGNFKGAVELLVSNMDGASALADEYLFWIAESCFQDHNYAAASIHYAKLIALYPDSPRGIESAVGEALANSYLGRTQQVIALLTKPDGVFAQAVLTKPSNQFVVRGLLLLSELQLAREDFAAAESVLVPLAGKELDAALEWRVQQLRCRILLAQDRAQEAWEISTNLPGLASASTLSRAQLVPESIAFQAQVLERLNRFDDAIDLLRENLASDVPVERQREALLKTAELSLALGKVSEARQTLNTFLRAHTNSPAADMVYLALGELDLKQHAAGVPMGGTIDTNSIVTNRLQRAAVAFDELLVEFPVSSLRGQALLGKGWCLWLAHDVTNSLPLFKEAAEKIPPSEEQAVARFKWADAEMACGNYTNALTNYVFLVENYSSFASVKDKLVEPALYLATRAAMAVNRLEAATNAVDRILNWFPNGFAGDRSLLLVGQGFLERKDTVRARELFDEFIKRWPESPLLPAVRLAIARSYEREGDWISAVGKYDEWLVGFTNGPSRPQAEFYRAWANYEAGRETNALSQFTNFVGRFATNDLAPAAQWWVADYFFRQGDYESAEKNYKLLFQTWPASSLAYEARMMAGRAALGRPDYPAAVTHFTNLTSDLSCPVGLKVQAMFAYGDALMQAVGVDTNKFGNFEEAIRVFGKIHQLNSTNAQAALAWGAMGNCYLQLATKDARFYDAATNAYQHAASLAAATVTARSQAQVGVGLALEKMALLHTAAEQEPFLKLALSNYLDVVYEKNLRDGETRDLFWVKKAGLEAGRLVESLQEWDQAVNLYRRLESLVPPLRDNLEKKVSRAMEQSESVKN